MIKNIYARWKYLGFLALVLFVLGMIAGIIHGYIINYDYFNPSETTALQLFRNNIKVCLFLAISGLMTGGVFTTLALLMNGYIIGLVVYGVSVNYGVFPLLYGLAPHFFIELAAILFCSIIGFMSGIYFLMYVGKVKKVPLFTMGRDSALFFLLTILLLICASFIESNISEVNL